MTLVHFGPDQIRVAPRTDDAWRALAQVMLFHGYYIRPPDTDSYNCRNITGGTGLSLHAYGIALDVNWGSNPYRRTPSRRGVRFSSQPTQHLRALEVKGDLADTDMTPHMIRDILAIETTGGNRVFEWGGSWLTTKDSMHFQLDVTPDELAAGINWESVRQQEEVMFARRGDKGPTVEYYQRKLARLSPADPGPPDADYGGRTAASVAAFQQSRVPPITEGVAGDYIGPWTRSELDRAEAERA